MKQAVRIFFVFGLLILGSCSGVKAPDTYTDSAGKTTYIETDRETCSRSCNSDYSRCMDSEPASTNSGLREDPVKMFGASSDCRADLKSCLNGCDH